MMTGIRHLNKQTINIATLNCKNIKGNYEYLNTLTVDNEIVFIQEH